jgi:hypothetical protein
MPQATMADDRPESDGTADTAPMTVSAAELHEVLAADEIFADLSDDTVQALAAGAEWVFVPAGDEVASVQLVSSGQADLFLTPPVQKFELLGFDAYQTLYEIGYEDTRKRLAEWDGLAAIRTTQPVSSSSTP